MLDQRNCNGKLIIITCLFHWNSTKYFIKNKLSAILLHFADRAWNSLISLLALNIYIYVLSNWPVIISLCFSLYSFFFNHLLYCHFSICKQEDLSVFLDVFIINETSVEISFYFIRSSFFPIFIRLCLKLWVKCSAVNISGG